jgi:hypothetical protein
LATESKSSGTSRCSSVNSGVEDPPGVQNFIGRLSGSRMPPAMSRSSRRVMPSGASYCPGVLDVPGELKMPKPVEVSVPIPANQSAAVQQDRRDGGDRLDIVDDRGRA